MTETERLLQIKAALKQTTNTIGWGFMKQMAENLVKQSIQASLDEDDRDKAEMKRLKAKALQAGFHDWFTAIEGVKTFATDDEPDWFASLNEFEANREQGNE